jgi:alanyl-tRNA synthetase
MEYELRADGTLTPLPQQNIDTGMGLERAATTLQDVIEVYETDGYRTIMDWIEDRSGVAHDASEDATKAHRVLADHGRGMTFLVGDGVTPSNEGRGYVLRRIIRRALQHGARIGLDGPFVADLADVVIEQMAAAYPELPDHAEEIKRVLAGEEERFSQTLARGMRLFEEIAEQAQGGDIPGDQAFLLHDTYGFPLELTEELARERGLGVNAEEFTRLMEEQRARSRGAGAFEVEPLAGRGEFVGYEQTEVLTAIIALKARDDGLFDAKLERSPFYPEGGGQVSDTGFIENEETGARAELVRATRFEDDQVLTFAGDGFKEDDRVRAVVPWSVRFPTMANHTATHLLHRALQIVLGDHVRQAGSAVRPDKLRFDFTHGQPVTPDQRAAIEELVNEKVFENRPVRAFITPIEEARKLGAMMLFGEKYGDEVRVVEIDDFSRELCGGTHVRSTAEIGPFAILSETSVGAGTRRIEAVTSGEAFAYLRARAHEADELRDELARQRKEAAKKPAAAESDITYRDESAGIVVAEVKALKGSELRDLSDRIRQAKNADAVLLGSVDDGRAYLVVNIDRSLVEKGVDAVAIARQAAKKIGGGGGGRPTLAEAGGRNPDGLVEAYEVGKSEITSALS